MERINTEDAACLRSRPCMCLSCLSHHTITQVICHLYTNIFQITFRNHSFFPVLYIVLVNIELTFVTHIFICVYILLHSRVTLMMITRN
jgi:hypothetical protein